MINYASQMSPQNPSYINTVMLFLVSVGRLSIIVAERECYKGWVHRISNVE